MIEDFGEKIDGAAKDRWSGFRLRLNAVEDNSVLDHPLSATFPEPSYKKLSEDGIDPWVLSFIRAARDGIASKPGPRQYSRRRDWASHVVKMRGLTRSLLDGTVSAEVLREAVAQETNGQTSLNGRIRAYEMLGHDKSLKDYKISNAAYRSLDGVRYDPPKRIWVIENRKDRFFSKGETIEEALAGLREHLDAQNDAPQGGSRGPKRKQFQIYHYLSKPDTHWIGRKIGGDRIDLFSFSSGREASAFLRDHFDQVVERYEALRKTPAERGATNAARDGKDHRGGRDISPGEFSATFGFRGVQFGNYVEGPRRQQDLNRAFDALMDLSEVLGCAPSALSLDGTLGLAFGARGTGGRNPAAAHYEPLQVVINLTKANGAGSLAHEWFHALDNLVGRRMGSATGMGTSLRQGSSAALTYEDRPAVEALARLGADLRSVPLYERSKTADKYRSSAYFSLSYEVGARAFEAWVIDRLARKGGHNDYLANIQDEEVYDAEARLLGLPDSRYPYPRKSEIEEVSRMFEKAFGPDGAIADLLGGLALEDLGDRPVVRPAVPEAAAPEEIEEVAPAQAAMPFDFTEADAHAGRFELDDDEEVEFG